MPTIFLALGQFSHYSDVLRGRLIGELARRYRVLVLTPAIDAAVAERDRYPSHAHIRYTKLSVANPRFWSIFDKYLRVPLVRSFDHLAYMRHFYQRPHHWTRKSLMRSRGIFPRSLFTTRRITTWERRWAPPNPRFIELVRREQPILLVTATPGFTAFEAECIIGAKRLGLTTAAININYDNLSSNCKMIRRTDYLAVWNGIMAGEARELHGYAEEQLAVTGCLRFDHYFTDPADPRFPDRERFFNSKGLNPTKKTVVLAGPTPSNYPPRRELVSELIRLRDSGAIAGNPNIFVRPHPIDPFDHYREFAARPGVHFERAGRQTRPDSSGGQKIEMGKEDLLNLTATLKYADVVLNFASTVIMEAAIFDRPVINVGFPEYRRVVYEFEYNKGLLDTGAVRLAKTPDELAVLMNLYFQRPELDRAERSSLVRTYIPFADGRSWARTVKFIEMIVGEIEKLGK